MLPQVRPVATGTQKGIGGRVARLHKAGRDGVPQRL
jgi:hypothetical protein